MHKDCVPVLAQFESDPSVGSGVFQPVLNLITLYVGLKLGVMRAQPLQKPIRRMVS